MQRFSYEKMSSLMQSATVVEWDRRARPRDPTELLTSRAYWALICAQYFPKTLYLVAANDEKIHELRTAITDSVKADLQLDNQAFKTATESKWTFVDEQLDVLKRSLSDQEALNQSKLDELIDTMKFEMLKCPLFKEMLG